MNYQPKAPLVPTFVFLASLAMYLVFLVDTSSSVSHVPAVRKKGALWPLFSFKRKFSSQGKTQTCIKSKNDTHLIAIDYYSMSYFYCYLLTSLDPRFKNHTYVGFTVDPGRRIKQHNGELSNGAKQTSRKRPWCVEGSSKQEFC